VWFRSVFLKTLRDYRVAILGWGIGMGVTAVSPMASVATLISTPQQREQLAGIASQFKWNADSIAVDTVGGYAMFKIGIFIFLIAVWPLLAGSRMLRGEEDQGTMDVLLSLPLRRLGVVVQKVAAMWVALAAMGVLIGIVTYLGGRAFKGEFGLTDALMFGLNLSLICAVIGGTALLISQFTSERGPAAGWTAGLLLIFIVVDMVHRVFPNTDWISRLSPIYYYNLSKPLVPSYGTSVGGVLVQLALAAVLSGAAVWLFVRRDVGGTVPLPGWLRLPARQPSMVLPVRDWSLRSIYARSLATIAMPAFWWTLGIAGFASWFIVVVQQLGSQLFSMTQGSAAIKTILQSGGGSVANFNASFLSAMFVFMPLLLMAFAVTQVNRWANDEDQGRLELVLATPQSRRRVILGRFAALATATIVISLITLAACAVAAAVSGLQLDFGKLAAASLGMIPMGLLIAAVGFLAAGWLRTAADTGLLSFLLAIWFFLSFIGPDLKWPDATLRLSPFYYYGSPLLQGISAANVLGLLVVGALALAAATLRFSRKDIGR
jgi:ABC-2 type transport system permease protein